MPSLKDSLAKPDPILRKPIAPQAPTRGQLPITSAPVNPVHLLPSPVLISGLPSISTDVDGITRQFYTTNNLPQRRLILPS